MPCLNRFVGSLCVASVLVASAAPAHADEIWVAPTYQTDFGGLGIGSNTFWPATAVGVARFAWAVPANLQTFQSATLVFIPHAFSPGGTGQLNVFVCRAQHSDLVGAACTAPVAHTFSSAINRLVEVDVSAVIGPQVGAAGLNYLTVLAYTTPTTTTDHLVGLRFTYEPSAPSGVPTLAANTFTGTQIAPAFVGDGAGVTNVNATTLDGLDSMALALAAHGHTVAQVTGAARLAGGNLFTGTQTLDAGQLDLDASTATTGNLFKDGQLFLHNIGFQNTFLGEQAGNLTLTGGANAALGYNALTQNATGTGNTAQGSHALFNNTTGSYNTASGYLVLFNTTTGTNNVALGNNAGSNQTTGSSNIYLGANVFGNAGESNTMYLGLHGLQARTFIGGVRGVTTGNGDAMPVVIDSAGQLGTAPGALATLGANTFSGTQTAPAFVGNGSGLTNLPFPAGAATLGANTFTGTQTLGAGNLDLAASTATGGSITKNGQLFLHSFGDANTFLGLGAGNLTMTGSNNAAIGDGALSDNTSGSGNTAVGDRALFSNTAGYNNTATGVWALINNMTGANNTSDGAFALLSNSTGEYNTATGSQSLAYNITGHSNTAYGAASLRFSTTGSNNLALGMQAGENQTTGSNNIYLGSNVAGVAGESNTMYLGKAGTHTKTFVAGIRDTVTAIANGIPVMIDAAGQLGTISSSIRYKEDIHDMADTSRRLLQLRPVTFRYTQAYSDGAKPLQYGLIAEEVAEVFPELAVRNANGEVETVHYETLNVLLLNEFQKLSAQVQSLKEEVERMRAR